MLVVLIEAMLIVYVFGAVFVPPLLEARRVTARQRAR